MRKKPVSSRHAKPTVAVLVNRIYRQQLAQYRDLCNQLAIVRLDRQADSAKLLDLAKAQAETIRRFLRQHDTLKQMPIWPLVERELIAANAFIAEPLKAGATNEDIPILAGTLESITAPAPSKAVLICAGLV